jgi:large subunit ribosomal protein L35Ae
MIQNAPAANDPLGVIVNYHIAYTKEVLVDAPGLNSKREAGKLIGKKAVWKDQKGVIYNGVVSGFHGRKGTLRVKFKSPLPPVALAKTVNIAE